MKTNVFLFKLPAETKLFRYNVTVVTKEMGTGYEKDLTKGANDE